jgi:hypothetical protein
MAKKLALWLLCLGVLAACGSVHKDYAVKDPIFEDQDNNIIYRSDGSRDYLMKDPIFADEDNYLIFRGDGSRDYLMRDPIFEDEDNWILFRDRGGDSDGS